MKSNLGSTNRLRWVFLAMAAFAFVIVTMVDASHQATAHASMNKSIPADGAVVKPGLEQIELQFSKAMRLTLVKVERAEDTTPIPTGDLPKSFVKSAQISAQPLTPGAYQVNWISIGKDGHMMKGKFSFTVAEHE